VQFPKELRRVLISLAFACIATCSCNTAARNIGPNSATTPPSQASGYTLVFADDFNSLALSPTGSGEFNWYNGLWWQPPSPPSNFNVANSILTLTWTKGQKPDDTSVTTLSRYGRRYHTWRYGYFEVRMKWNTVRGAWPAIWMLPVEAANGATTAAGELDIFEGQGSTPHIFYGTVHEWKQQRDVRNNKGSNVFELPASVDLSQFHNYGALWTPGRVTWYFDNRPLFSAPTYPVFDTQNYYLIIGSQEGVNWKNGDLTGVTDSRIDVDVDWIHVWQRE
jgi:beta-glucanase (GH16 family)